MKGAIEDFAQELATVIGCFQKLEAWRDPECIVVGGGLRATRVGERVIGRAAVILKADKVSDRREIGVDRIQQSTEALSIRRYVAA